MRLTRVVDFLLRDRSLLHETVRFVILRSLSKHSVAALCSEPEFEDAEQDTLTNPSLIIEVLSDSTERYDRGDKFAPYRRLTSLQDYVLVSQHRPLVEHFTRHGEEWILRMAEGLEASLPLPAMGCELPLADIYDKVSSPVRLFLTGR